MLYVNINNLSAHGECSRYDIKSRLKFLNLEKPFSSLDFIRASKACFIIAKEEAKFFFLV